MFDFNRDIIDDLQRNSYIMVRCTRNFYILKRAIHQDVKGKI